MPRRGVAIRGYGYNRRRLDTGREAEYGQSSDDDSGSTHGPDNSSGRLGFVDTPNDEALESLSDMVEYYAEKLVLDKRENRLMTYKAFTYFWHMHPMNKHKFGRLHARNLLCNCILATCIESPYPVEGQTDDEDSDEGHGAARVKPMTNWDRRAWSEVYDEFNSLLSLALRRDTNNLFNFWLPDRDVARLCNEHDIDKELAKLSEFDIKAESFLKRIEIQRAVAPIREQIENRVRKGKQPKIPQRLLEEVRDFTKRERHQGVRAVVLNLYEQSKGEVKLKPWEELADIIDNNYFSLQNLQRKAEKLLQSWNRLLFRESPVLVMLKYRIDTDEEVMDENVTQYEQPSQKLKHLKRRRRALRNEHGVDPLAESRRIAAEATGIDFFDDAEPVYTGRPRDRHESGVDEKYGPHGSEETNEQEELSELPTPRKRIRPSSIFSGVQPDEGIFRGDGRVIKRRKWSEQEVGAIKKGVVKHGKGKWAQIKKDYAAILRNRSTVQIKDKWRTMEQKGEVGVFLQEEQSEDESAKEQQVDTHHNGEEVESVHERKKGLDSCDDGDNETIDA